MCHGCPGGPAAGMVDDANGGYGALCGSAEGLALTGPGAPTALSSAWRVVNAQSVGGATPHWKIGELVMLDAEGQSTTPQIRRVICSYNYDEGAPCSDDHANLRNVYDNVWSTDGGPGCWAGSTDETQACHSWLGFEFERPVTIHGVLMAQGRWDYYRVTTVSLEARVNEQWQHVMNVHFSSCVNEFSGRVHVGATVEAQTQCAAVDASVSASAFEPGSGEERTGCYNDPDDRLDDRVHVEPDPFEMVHVPTYIGYAAVVICLLGVGIAIARRIKKKPPPPAAAPQAQAAAIPMQQSMALAVAPTMPVQQAVAVAVAVPMAQAAPQVKTLTATVPGGQHMQYQSPTGQMMNVQVPPGVQPGQQFQCQVVV